MRFEEFVHRELAGLSRFAGALTGDRWLAEDVLSDALIAVGDKWDRIAAMQDPASYVRRVVVTTFLSDRRKTSRRRTAPTSDPVVLERVVPNHDDAVAERDEIERMLTALPPQQKVAVVMRYLLDQDDDQIAHVLDCAPATVRSHLSHARAALRLSADTPSGRE